VANETTKQNEIELFKKWRQTENPQYFHQLYNSMKPLIYDAARKASFNSNIPESAHRAWAAQSFMNALRTFNPSGGAALQSHVYTAVHQKAKRLNYEFQNLGHMPEPRAQSVGLFQSEFENLKAGLGREPSDAELADHLGWSLSMVGNIRKEIKKDLALGEGTEDYGFFESSQDEEVLNYLYYDLNPQEKVVYEYIFGKNGKPRMIKANQKIDFDGIARNMGVTNSRVRTTLLSIREKLKKALKK